MKLRTLIIAVLSLICINVNAVTLQECKALVEAKDYAAALTALRTLMQQPRYTKHPETNKYYGQCLCMLGKYEEALKPLEIGAKGGPIGAYWYLGIAKQHLYDFEGAIDALKKYRAACSSTSGWIERTDSIIAECELGWRGVNHVQDIVIIDSLFVPKREFFSFYELGFESGHILSAAECEGEIATKADSTVPVFENIAKDQRIVALRNADGSSNLYTSHKFGGEWTELEKIESVGSENYKVNYPFLRTDGETLYFACDSTPGYGGFDIYKTRFNPETDSFLAPVRLGMPFNSPYNDYMLAIDETHQVGWWATERYPDDDFVCLYLFLFDEEAEFLDGTNVRLAKIEGIGDTWKKSNYNDLLYDIHNAPQLHKPEQEMLFIPIKEGVVYMSLDDFATDKALRAFDNYSRVKGDLLNSKEELQQLRMEYREASEVEKKMLKIQILQKEALMLSLRDQMLKVEKEFRNAELGVYNSDE